MYPFEIMFIKEACYLLAKTFDVITKHYKWKVGMPYDVEVPYLLRDRKEKMQTVEKIDFSNYEEKQFFFETYTAVEYVCKKTYKNYGGIPIGNIMRIMEWKVVYTSDQLINELCLQFATGCYSYNKQYQRTDNTQHYVNILKSLGKKTLLKFFKIYDIVYYCKGKISPAYIRYDVDDIKKMIEV